MKARLEAVWCFLILAAAGWAYFATASYPTGASFRRQPDGYYPLLTSGFRGGHLYVPIEPAPALLALKDPYDPVANAPYRVHDMSLWRGRYYLYYGVTPVVILFWPVAALTGWYPTESFAVFLFALGGVAAASGLLLAFRRRYCPSAPSWVAPVGTLCLAFGTPILALTQYPQFYQVPIACAYFLLMASLGALYRALHSARRAAGWLALASLAFGLSVGARPNFLFAGVAVAIVWAWLLVEAVRAGRSRWIALTTAAFGPAAVCGAGLMIYNYLRFGSIAEFGVKYILQGFIPTGQTFAVSRLGSVGRSYLFEKAAWSPYFPFFAPTGNYRSPPGMVRYLPWIWLAPAALMGWGRSGQGKARVFAWTVMAAASANLAVLSVYLGANMRYACDFQPEWLLSGGLGALVLLREAAGWSKGRRWMRRAAAVAAGFTVFTGLAGYFAAWQEPDRFIVLARALDWPAYAWERVSGQARGALALDLELPAGRTQGTEPLFQTGHGTDRWDCLLIDYLPGHQARLRFFHAGIGSVAGAEFQVPANRRITLEARCGSLLPPRAHPLFSGLSRRDYDAFSRDIRVTVNGAEVLRAEMACYESAPQELRIGQVAAAGGGIAARFSGRILGWRRLPVSYEAPPHLEVREAAPVRLTVLLPADRRTGLDPLLATGAPQKGDLLYCAYDGLNRVELGLYHFGMGGPRSEALTYDPARPHVMEIWMGSLAGATVLPAPARSVPWKDRLVVTFDGRVALNLEQIFYAAGRQSAVLAENAYGESLVGATFAGRILRAEPVPFGAMPSLVAEGEYGAVDMEVLLPANALGAAQPLVVTGVSGAGDIVYLRYLDPTHVSANLDHWGYPGINGPPVEVDYSAPHRIQVVMQSLFRPGTADGAVRVVLDGKTILAGSLPGHPSLPRQIRIGENPIGGSTCGREFTGRILKVRREPVGAR